MKPKWGLTPFSAKVCMRHIFRAPCVAEAGAANLYSVSHQDTEDEMNTKLILQAATTFLVLSLGSGLLPAGMGAAEAFQSTARHPKRRARGLHLRLRLHLARPLGGRRSKTVRRGTLPQRNEPRAFNLRAEPRTT